MKNNSSFRQIAALLRQKTQHVTGFKHHLEEIKTAITSNDIDKLNGLISQTTEFFGALNTSQSQLLAFLNEQGNHEPHHALQHFIKQHDDEQQQLHRLNETLNEQLDSLEKALLVNDLLIRKNQHRIKQSIRILSGHEQTNKPSTYSSTGDTNQQGDSQHTLAHA